MGAVCAPGSLGVIDMKPLWGFSSIPTDNLPFPVGGKLPPEVFQMSMTENVTISDCEHALEQMVLIDSEYQGDSALFVFQCACGQTVTQIFQHTQTFISD